MKTLVIRPVTLQDHAQMMELANLAGFGMTSLPQDESVMHRKIEDAVKSFAGTPPLPNEHIFLFVLEDSQTRRIVGTTGIKSHVGLSNPFYSYKLSTLVQSNSDLGIYSRQKVLHMVNDFTGATEIGSLFLHAQYRRKALGPLLSRCRFLMLAEFPELFSDTVVSEIRGVHDENGDSPFYNNVARHFFQMPFYKADYINATKGNQFISDLMPRYPIYVTLLPPAAQAVIGKTFAPSEPAARILVEEGFYHEDYVDVFDAGPTLQAERERIATVCGSKKAEVTAVGQVQSDKRFMIGGTTLSNLRFVLDQLQQNEDGSVAVSPETAQRLQVDQGDQVRFAPQFPPPRLPVQAGVCQI
ncbi:MAG: arginine N-succinyltransferase [Desulfobacteraceae bacterium]|nr:MAG: arginine N-succinyltransferase [Desulfobacteraceae bacterium]